MVLAYSDFNQIHHLIENTDNDDEPLIKHALQHFASDIHIEPYEHSSRIRYRQDGILYEITKIPKKLADRFITRLKVLAKLDISERRLPQDGRFQQHQTDIRINTCPTLFGEKVVLRLLNNNQYSLSIDSLGLSKKQEKIFYDALAKPQGMILATGPTGSGKTVTLYSALHFLNTTDKNISTVEDPVEIKLFGVNQVNVNAKIGLDFSTVLRAFLRQDPDIMMVGEIRDLETAEIAIKAAQTGHLVLSTLHTNNAIETITRLLAMGVPAHHLTQSLNLIIAQRLLRVLCPHCKIPEKHSSNITTYRSGSCHQCLQGYRGRVGIYEFLPLTENISQLIFSAAPIHNIIAYAKNEGFTSLQEIGTQKIMQGITSFSELYRVLGLS